MRYQVRNFVGEDRFVWVETLEEAHALQRQWRQQLGAHAGGSWVLGEDAVNYSDALKTPIPMGRGAVAPSPVKGGGTATSSHL